MASPIRMTVLKILTAFPGKHLVLSDCKYRKIKGGEKLISAVVVSTHDTWQEAYAGIPDELRGAKDCILFDPEPPTKREIASRNWMEQKLATKLALMKARRAG